MRDGFSLGDLVEGVLEFFGFDEEVADMIGDAIDEPKIIEAAETALMEMEAMVGNAGQEVLVQQVASVWVDVCIRNVEGGDIYGEIASIVSHIDAIEEIVLEGEAIFYDELES